MARTNNSSECEKRSDQVANVSGDILYDGRREKMQNECL